MRAAGTFDHLIISVCIHLAHIHDHENVAILSADDRLTDILSKCLDGIAVATMRKLKLDTAEAVTGRKFEPETFPRYANLKTATNADLEDLFARGLRRWARCQRCIGGRSDCFFH